MAEQAVAVAEPLVQRRPQRRLGAGVSRVPVVVWICAAILVVMCLAAVLAPLIAPKSPFDQSLILRLKPPVWLEDSEPGYILGTDEVGRDILSRMIYGAQTSLAVGLVGVMIGSVLGTLLGMLAGYFSGPVDEIIMLLADMQLAFPFILLAIAIVAVLGPDPSGSVPWKLIIIVGVSGWMTYARVCRGVVLTIKEREFVQSVRALGGSDGRILLRHILPNAFTPWLVVATLDMARVIVIESALSFLGLGVQPPTPTWGGMLADGRVYISTAWWLATFPGLAILMTVLGINLFGDGLRDTLDPRLNV